MNMVSARFLRTTASAALALSLLTAPAMAAKSDAPEAGHGKKASHGGSDSHPQEGGPAVSGKVVETMNSGGYTYVRLENMDGESMWVAVPEFKVKVGEVLFFNNGMEMQNFNSKSMNRTFDKILFSSGPVKLPGSKGVSKESAQGLKGHGLGPTEHVKLDKPETANGYSIADVYAKAASLDKKQVTIRGHVVKYSASIMGKNWLHLQDGTGDPKKANHDIVVTSDDDAEVGDTVTATGTVVKDKDFGSGYSYDVIIEDAKVVKEASDKTNTKLVPAPDKSPAPLKAHSVQ